MSDEEAERIELTEKEQAQMLEVIEQLVMFMREKELSSGFAMLALWNAIVVVWGLDRERDYADFREQVQDWISQVEERVREDGAQ